MVEDRAAARATALAAVAERAKPVALAREHVLPVVEPLQPLLPDGLRRGTTVAVGRSTSLALALIAGPSAAGSWLASAGVSTLGLAAAAEFGVALDRVVVVASPPAETWAAVVATLVEAFDVVLLRATSRVRAGDARRLAARARESGTVLVVLDGAGAYPEPPDVRLDITDATWTGIGDGHGYLQARRVEVTATGRRGAARSRRAALWLPGPSGAVESTDLATVHEFPVAQ